MYVVGEHKIKVCTSHGSMSPSPYTLFLAKNIPRYTKPTTVIDYGSGCGIQGLVAHKQGASQIYCIDTCSNAIADSKITLSDVSNSRCIVADVFSDKPFADLKLPEHSVHIICNPPSLPMPESNTVSKHYIASVDGRKFIDRFLDVCSQYLRKEDNIHLCHTSLANLTTTYKRCRLFGLRVKVIKYKYPPFGLSMIYLIFELYKISQLHRSYFSLLV